MTILLSDSNRNSVDSIAKADVITALVDVADVAQLPVLHAELTAVAKQHGFAVVAPINYSKLSKDGRFKLLAFRKAQANGFSSFSDLK